MNQHSESGNSPPRVRRRHTFAEPLPPCKVDPPQYKSWDAIKSSAMRRTECDTVARVNGHRVSGGAA